MELKLKPLKKGNRLAAKSISELRRVPQGLRPTSLKKRMNVQAGSVTIKELDPVPATGEKEPQKTDAARMKKHQQVIQFEANRK